MKPTFLVSLLLATSALVAQAQDFSVVQFGKRTVFQADANQLAVLATEDGAVIARPDLQETQINLPKRWAQIRRTGAAVAPASLAAFARTRMTEQVRHPKVSFTAPVLKTPEGDEVVPTPSLLLKLKTTQDVAAFLRARGINSISSIKRLTSDGIHEITTSLRDGAAVMDLAATLAARSEVKLAVPNFLRKAQATRTPTDPDFEGSLSWGLRAMSGPTAWDVTTGSSSVIVAVFDGGIQQDHPEINQVQGVSTSPLQGSNGDATPAPEIGHDHGIMVASCISGKIDNAIGSCGIAPSARCISVRWCTPVIFPGQDKPTLVGLDSDIVTGLGLAAEAGARISVHSYRFAWVSQGMEEAFAATREQGMIHFAATGNDADKIVGFDANPSIHYPASSPFVLGVGASTIATTRAAFSQFGSANQRTAAGVDFMAPGQSIAAMGRTGMPGMSDTRVVDGNGVSGTSFATPYAAGVAALILSVKPSLTPRQVEDLMIAGCRDMEGAGWDKKTGFGLVNAFASLPDDHGDTAATATTVNATSTTSGHLNRTTDADVFKFTVSDFSRIKVHTTGQVRTEVQILNFVSGGGTGYNVRNTASSAFPGWTTGNFRTDIALEPGTYTARVTGRDSSIGLYQLHIALEAAFPEITVIGNGEFITDGDTTPALADHTSFGTVRLGTSMTRTFTIRNTGDSVLRISNSTNLDDSRVDPGFNANVNVNSELNQAHGGVSNPTQNALGNDPHALPDPNAPRFIDSRLTEIQNRAIKISQSPSFQVLPGRSTTFTVRFTSKKIGNFTQKLTIQSNDADEASFDFMVGGTAFGMTAPSF